MTPPDHIDFFSPANLSRLLRRIGFADIKIEKPWKFVPLGLILYQLGRIVGLPLLPTSPAFNRIGLYINLFDAFRIGA